MAGAEVVRRCALLLALCAVHTIAINSYAVNIVHGSSDAFGSDTQLALRINKAGTNVSNIIGVTQGLAPTITYEPATGGPWSYALRVVNNSFAYYSLNVLSTFNTLCPNQAIAIDACFAGAGNGSTSQVIQTYISSSQGTADAGDFVGFTSWSKLYKGNVGAACTQTIFIPLFVQFSVPFRIEVWAKANDGIMTTNTTSSLGIRARTLPMEQAAALAATPKAMYTSVSATFVSYLGQVTGSLQFITPTIYTQTEFPSGAPWTFNVVALEGTSNYLMYLEITDATKLANMRLEVDMTLSGGTSASCCDNIYAYMKISGNGGGLTSMRSMMLMNNGAVASQLYIPFMIPNRYLVNGAQISFYAHSNRNPGTSLTTANSFTVSVSAHKTVLS